MNLPTREDLLAAADRVRPHLHRTPVLTSSTFDQEYQARLFFKCENFQKIGAFKARGGVNAVFQLTDEELQKGVVTHSSGNHAQAVAYASRARGAKATIVMPENSPKVKIAAVQGYGAEVVLCQPTLESRQETCNEIQARTGAVIVHPYNDWRIIAGQSTAAQELFQEHPDLDLLLTPVGGGGLLSGSSLAAHYFSPKTRVVGTEPKTADDAKRSLDSGVLQKMIGAQTIADGLRTSLGAYPFEAIRRHVADIVTVSEDGIIRAMRLIWERMKIIIEPSCAVPMAAILEGAIDVRGQNVGIILTGGNVDLDSLPWLSE